MKSSPSPRSRRTPSPPSFLCMSSALLLVASRGATSLSFSRVLPGRRLASAPLRAASDTAVAPPPTKKRTVTRRILSGVQPTGSIHLGNYLGAIKQWADLQDSLSVPLVREVADEKTGGVTEITEVTENFFCVVDLHAITAQPHDPDQLLESTYKSAALYLAAGIDPAKSKVFVQSHVPAHSELAWLLNCATPMNWLERMIQYKEKARKQGDGVGVGLFAYPVLMAADILLYQADRVPVGEDQRQHLELTRDISRRFNDQYCKGNKFKKRAKAAGFPSRPVFTEPEAMIVKEGARVMSLTDGTSKMSKSDPSDGE
uniref:tryptophan--tRNA ligase n=1 Tax=Corethron hystrix TaxID=216773 RepID=A0A7S1BNT3_9STRA|mmetsp:Transcript_35660/g.82946  ORF Transcript_35660/g.82946 Transcript_35660/m.82946 type:complete len:315 (+) Transcript_35660:92-1036(+)